jgi:hypothetical protein
MKKYISILLIAFSITFLGSIPKILRHEYGDLIMKFSFSIFLPLFFYSVYHLIKNFIKAKP